MLATFDLTSTWDCTESMVNAPDETNKIHCEMTRYLVWDMTLVNAFDSLCNSGEDLLEKKKYRK